MSEITGRSVGSVQRAHNKLKKKKRLMIIDLQDLANGC